MEPVNWYKSKCYTDQSVKGVEIRRPMTPPLPLPQEFQIKQEPTNLQEQKEKISQQREQQPTPDQPETCVSKIKKENKRTPSFKVNNKSSRWRQNARLRKILKPKNAMIVLNELNVGINYSFQEHTNALREKKFVVNAMVDDKIYVGQGLSKRLAKQNAAENALKALLLGKMANAYTKGVPIKQPGPDDTSSGSSDIEGSGAWTSGEESAVEDDVPWRSLASFALYKLFTEWQIQETHVPIPKHQCPTPSLLNPQPQNVPGTMKEIPDNPTPSPLNPQPHNIPGTVKKIPDNPTERHPVMLLNQLYPNAQYFEVNRVGVPRNLTFTMGVSLEGKQYEGVANSKKEAKKGAAISALAGAFDIHYTK